MKSHITTAMFAAVAAITTTALQAGEPVAAPMSPSVADCPWGLSLDVLYLKVHSNEGNFGDNEDNEFGYRAAISYKSGDNLGLRLRYMDFEGSDAFTAEVSALDAEVFDNFTLGSWNGEFSAGVRYATYEEPDGGSPDVDFDGFGPTVGVELTRSINGPLSFYANARTSLVFGEDSVNEDDSFVAIAELGLGLQYDIDLGGCPAYIRLGVEAQNWASLSSTDNEDTALFGGVLGIGMSF